MQYAVVVLSVILLISASANAADKVKAPVLTPETVMDEALAKEEKPAVPKKETKKKPSKSKKKSEKAKVVKPKGPIL